MKKLFFYIAAIVLFANSCQQKKEVEVEANIFLRLSNIEYNSDDSTAVEQSLNNAFFGKEFWNYFFKKYPISTDLIFPDKALDIWGISKFGATYDRNVDTSKYYFSKMIDMDLRQRINSHLPDNPQANERRPGNGTQTGNPSPGEIKLNNSISNDYQKFRRLLADTSYKTLTLYCDKEILLQIRSHKYAL